MSDGADAAADAWDAFVVGCASGRGVEALVGGDGGVLYAGGRTRRGGEILSFLLSFYNRVHFYCDARRVVVSASECLHTTIHLLFVRAKQADDFHFFLRSEHVIEFVVVDRFDRQRILSLDFLGIRQVQQRIDASFRHRF